MQHGTPFTAWPYSWAGLVWHGHTQAGTVIAEGVVPAGSYLDVNDNLPDYIKLYRIGLSVET